jgi:tRNA nucleotidyltransferase (CCA-adding enzyme)
MTYLSPTRLPAAAHHCLRRLHEAGFEAFVVGGWVRDQLLNIDSHDVDIATDAQPEAILACFEGHRTSQIGQKHGTIGVFVDELWIEITTYRVEVIGSDARHPAAVDFVRSLKEDIIRRDFTINALVMDHQGTITDWVSGLDDLSQRRVRCVGDPDQRFKEDALRILRAIRFMCKLNFKLDPETRLAMSALKDLVQGLARERVLVELEAILEAPYAQLALDQCADVMSVVLPELTDAHLPSESEALRSFELRLVYLYAQLEPTRLQHRLHELKCSNAQKQTALAYRNLMDLDFTQRIAFKRALGQKGITMIEDALNLKVALGHINDASHLKMQAQAWLDQGACLSLKDLAIGGHEAMHLGYQGAEIERALNRALDAVLDEKIDNSPQAIRSFLKQSAP